MQAVNFKNQYIFYYLYRVKASEINTNLNTYINSFIIHNQNDNEELVKQIVDNFQSIVLKKRVFGSRK
jgi:hypothetical protein